MPHWSPQAGCRCPVDRGGGGGGGGRPRRRRTRARAIWPHPGPGSGPRSPPGRATRPARGAALSGWVRTSAPRQGSSSGPPLTASSLRRTVDARAAHEALLARRLESQKRPTTPGQPGLGLAMAYYAGRLSRITSGPDKLLRRDSDGSHRPPKGYGKPVGTVQPRLRERLERSTR
jgi:hypothetical protein